jgi:colanic acid/amylovoran biosynthesis protein WcaK/AmsJ
VKILITNIVTLNAGDAAILYATIDVLRAAFGEDAEFVVYDKHGEAPARYYPDLVFRKLLYLSRESKGANSVLSRFHEIRFELGLWVIKHGIPLLPHTLLSSTERRDLLEYKNADLIVSSGGTYLVENYSLAARIFDYQLSLYLEKPLVFFTQSLGPFNDPSNRKALRPIFENSTAILVRDEQSLANLEELGISNTKIHVVADAAFALSDLAALESAKVSRVRSADPLRVVISVREWRHFKSIESAHGMKQYIDALRTLTTHLIEKHNAEITYLSTCQGMPEYWTDDSKLAKTIVDGLPDEMRRSVSVDSSFHRPVELGAILKNYDLVIATRMHMAIIALGAGTPVLPIAYEFKMNELFKRLGQERWVQNLETVSGDGLIKALDQILETLPQMRDPLFTAVKREHASAVASGQIVKQAYEDWRRAKHE